MVRYEDSSLIDKISFLCTCSGFILVLFSFQSFLTLGNDAELAMFIISFLFYIAATLTVVCYVTMGEVEDGMLVRAVHMGSAFLAGVFLVVGIGLQGERLRKLGAHSPYATLLGVVALVLILASFALGVFTLLLAQRSTKPQESSTEASRPSGPTTFSG